MKETFYWCGTCDVYGRGSECWSCADDEIEKQYVPRSPLPKSTGLRIRELID